MNTPILKATKGKNLIQFYNDGEFEEWKNMNDLKGWNIKYYKGLGTSTSAEFKDYFKEKKFIEFISSGKQSAEALDMVFNKKRSDDRKHWLENYDRQSYLDTSCKQVYYENFINKDFIHFSKADCDRSINNLEDGLKNSLRKIIYSAFKKNLNTEIKVSQFSGYVSEHSGYHHGEASLNAAIIGLAQNFVGSNNINLLKPNGQFGTRLLGGKDAASERYIFTQLSEITKYIFIQDDFPILEYRSDDGETIEPICYCPIIPMVLANGAIGIGTGFSTSIPQYNPIDLINNQLAKLMGEEINDDLTPWYKNFTGEIKEFYSSQNKKYIVKGKFEKIGSDKIKITELPVGTWTQDFKEHLESLMDSKKKDYKAIIKDYKDNGTEITIDITLTFYPNCLNELLKNVDVNQTCSEKITELEKILKLYNIISTSNMHLFDEKEQLRKFNTVKEIQDEFYKFRLKMYSKRKAYQLKKLKLDMKILSNKARFIKETLKDNINLKGKKSEKVNELLIKMKFDKDDEKDNFNYLIKMPMDSVIDENVEKLMKEHDDKSIELKKLENKDEEEIWIDELNLLKQKYKEFLNYKPCKDKKK